MNDDGCSAGALLCLIAAYWDGHKEVRPLIIGLLVWIAFWLYKNRDPGVDPAEVLRCCTCFRGGGEAYLPFLPGQIRPPPQVSRGREAPRYLHPATVPRAST